MELETGGADFMHDTTLKLRNKGQTEVMQKMVGACFHLMSQPAEAQREYEGEREKSEMESSGEGVRAREARKSLLEHQVMAEQALKLQPGLTVLILPQLELRTSRAHSWRCYRVVSITADHQSGGSVGHLRSRRGSQLAQRLKPAPRLQSQAPLRPCPRQGRETPGQAAETLPAADCLMLATEGIQAKGQSAGI
ncbi:hypothetical protein EYF80_035770 [Liparis tanakae]|uniref:Uncharacterized protein n=1 Tax=Liparis tanakae TaxID=230148 RepID=A0A4Z2GMX0_9TELE|nr:hypothetical protein EYF80_035770 [Liparis tanakae]